MAKRVAPIKINSIWMLTREYDGLAGAGGVKDVCRQLAEALVRTGRTVSVVMPFYGFMDPEIPGLSEGPSFAVAMDYVGRRRLERVTVRSLERNGVRLFLLDSGRYRDKRSIYTYTAVDEAADPFHRQGDPHYDYFAVNVLLQKAALALMVRLRQRPSVIHCHDGHTAVLPAMVRETEGLRHYFNQTGMVVTIHNAGRGYHQEVDDLPYAGAICGLPAEVVRDNLLDDRFDPFLVASRHAVLNTVSENYALELQESDDDLLTGWLGHRLLERGIRLQGITNGINPADFDPTRPESLGLPAAFAPAEDDLAGKALCRRELCRLSEEIPLAGIMQSGRLDWHPGVPLFTLIGRLMVQKGVDILVTALRRLLAEDREFQVVVLGTGAPDIEDDLIRLAEMPAYRGRVCLLRGYDQKLANLIYAAGDFFLIPSRYEPCGLTDYLAQLMGNLPIVHHVGGLVKVVDGVTGFAFREHSGQTLAAAMQRAMSMYRQQPETLGAMRQEAVRHIGAHYTWDRVVHRYLKLYQQAAAMAMEDDGAEYPFTAV